MVWIAGGQWVCEYELLELEVVGESKTEGKGVEGGIVKNDMEYAEDRVRFRHRSGCVHSWREFVTYFLKLDACNVFLKSPSTPENSIP